MNIFYTELVKVSKFEKKGSIYLPDEGCVDLKLFEKV